MLAASSLCIIGVSLFLFFSDREKEPTEAVIGRHIPAEPILPPLPRPPPRTVTPELPGPETAPPAGLLAIVIDDIGYDLSFVDDLLSLDIPITFGVLPHCPYSVQAARRAHQAGHEVILHMPMEPYEYPLRDPGEGALLVTMTDRELRDMVQTNLRAVPHITGVNNHMGSRFMEDKDKLVLLFTELHRQGLFFLDSRTTTRSMAQEAAETTGIPFISRDVFADNCKNKDATVIVLKDAIENSQRWDSLVVIGHPYESTLQAIQRVLPALQERGIKPVHLSALLEH